MWSKLKIILQEPSYQRLALAMLGSILLHSLLFGGLDLSLPSMKKEYHTLEARLQMPKKVAKPAAEPSPLPEALPTKATPTKKPQKQIKVPNPAETPLPAPIEETNQPIAEPETLQAPVEKPPEPPVILPETTPPQETNAAEQPVDAGLIVNENAYQYVETEFEVSTKIDGPAEGKSTIIYDLVDDVNFKINSVSELIGPLSAFFPTLKQTSEGTLTKTGLQPLNFSYTLGNKTDKTRKAKFDWANHTITHETSKGTSTDPLNEGAQDMLSFMYQFMYVAPLQKMAIYVSNGKKLKEYDYSFEGEELVASKGGEFKALHLVHANADTEDKTEVWLALDYQYLPVKIRKTDKEGKVYELVATRINISRPAKANNP